MTGLKATALGLNASSTNPPRGDAVERRLWLQDRPGNVGSLHLRKDYLASPAEGEARVAVKAVREPCSGIIFTNVSHILDTRLVMGSCALEFLVSAVN